MLKISVIRILQIIYVINLIVFYLNLKMDNPIYPPEWINLRLELKDDIKLKTIKNEIKKEDKLKVKIVRPASILKNPNEKKDYLKNKDKNHFKFCNCM